MPDCEHQFINTKYGDDGKVEVRCSTCHVDVTKPRHIEMAKLYLRPNDQVD